MPREIAYLQGYDQARRRIEAFLHLPDATFDLMMGFLRQNGGRLSHPAPTNASFRCSERLHSGRYRSRRDPPSTADPSSGNLGMPPMDAAHWRPMTPSGRP